MKKALLLFSCLLFAASSLLAQRLSHVQGEILVRLEPSTNPHQWAARWQTFEGANTRARMDRLVSKPLNIWLMAFDHTVTNERSLLAAVRRHPDVAVAQFNHQVTMRSTVPDDPGFDQQWQYINTGQTGGLVGADIDVDLAWDITTGGITATGDTIVVAVLDDGLDLNHEDFEDNHWINHAEIPDNDIDDDNNGYVDDYLGWNILSDTDNIGTGGSHGTPVAGIIGAKGNNGIGVAGVSWNVKVMIVKNNFNTNEALVLEAYTYPLVQRMRYNESNGEEGAFVVATNASWGTDFGDPEDAPLWCAFYDTLGVHGILSCGATANGNINVDEQGDLPTACPSDHLITVTNMNHNDVKVTQAGYGTNTIDLGAFGANTWTTALGNNYSGFGGTSGATPHVTGTVGLLYSAPCPAFMALVKSDPSAAALLVKQAILEGTDPNESLQDITVTGGRLNVFKSLMILLENCGGCFSPSSQNISDLTDVSATLNWNINDSIQRVDIRWREVGAADWNEEEAVTSPYDFEGLLACTEYELQLRAFCSSDTLDYGLVKTFKTDGCCELPASFSIDAFSDSSALFSWGSVLAASSYDVQLIVGGEVFNEFNTSTPELQIPSGLPACTAYEVQIRTVCANTTTEFGVPYSFQTTGCGFCRDLIYCIPEELDASEEWIEEVRIDTFQLISGSNDSYGNFTESTNLVLEQGGAYPILLVPGYAGSNYQEYFKIWIDYGKDGAFDDEDIVFDAGDTVSDSLSATLNIAADAPLGSARLRILMRYQNAASACAGGSDNFGEAEDYCVEILPAASCRTPANLLASELTENTAQLDWESVGAAIGYVVRYKKEGFATWTEASSTDNFLLLQNLDSCQTYEVQVRSVCAMDVSDFSDTLRIATECVIAVDDVAQSFGTLAIQPNPFHQKLQLNLTTPTPQRRVELVVLSPFGQSLKTQYLEHIAAGNNRFELDLTELPPGAYWIRLRSEDGASIVQKVIKI